MSITFGKGDILWEQRLLACGGFYTGALDGLWGKMSESAAQQAQIEYERTRERWGAFDTRSEDNIRGLLPQMQIATRKLLAVAKGLGVDARIVSGTRTYAEQNILYAQRPKVTNARGGQSNHNFGVAVDVGLFDANGRYLTGATRAEEKAYMDLAAAVKVAVKGIEWGGDWRSFKDQPHYELALGLSAAERRRQFEAGKLTRS